MQLLKELLKKYFSTFVYFYRYLGYRIFVVLGLSIAIGMLDAFGLTMFLPILELTDGQENATGEGLGNLGFIIEWLDALGIKLTLIMALSVLLTFFLLKGVATYISTAYNVIVTQFFISTLRLKLTELFTKYSYKNFVSTDMGRVQNAFTTEVERVVRAYASYTNGIQQVLIMLVYMVFVILIDWQFAILMIIGGFLTNLIYSPIYKITKDESRNLSRKNSRYHKSIIQYINNFKYLKATGLLNPYTNKLRNDIKDIEYTNKRMAMLRAVISSTREPLLIIVVCAVIVIQVYVFEGRLATILMSLLLFYRALNLLINFQTNYNSFLSSVGSLENISDFEKELKVAAEIDGKVKFKKFTKSIQLENISFGYQKNDLILKNISLTIKKNHSIAFVGESGSGKTTLVNVISGLLSTTNGNFKIDGLDFCSLKRVTYQRRIGYIAQEPVIFNDSIFNNVTFWAEPTKENLQKFQDAISKASIDEFINELPDKEQTLLGNNGINLSGGQRQRISIARELYKDIDILILDEATSALDSETEREIQYNIDELKGEYTIIIIAHRLSTIKNVDQIYLMDKGKIIEHGNFIEMTDKSPLFHNMVKLQEL